MTVLLDNLTAILVGSTLLVAMLVVQQRGQQSAIDATARYQSETLTSQFISILERDVENIRTMEEMEAAFGARRFALPSGLAPTAALFEEEEEDAGAAAGGAYAYARGDVPDSFFDLGAPS